MDAFVCVLRWTLSVCKSDHGTEPGLVHFCDFLAFPLQLFSHLCLQLRSPSGAALCERLCERLCVKVPVEASVCKSVCV